MNVRNSIPLKIFLVTLAVYVGQLIIGGMVYGLTGPVWENAPPFSETAIPMFATALLMVMVLVHPARHSRLRGWRLFVALFLALFGLNVVLLTVEGAIFLFLTPGQVVSIVLMATLSNAWLALLVTLVFGGMEPLDKVPVQPGNQRTPSGWILVVGLISVCYMLLYISAGLMIIPFVQDFYETQNIPTGAWFIPFQVLRGLGYILFTLYLVRSISASRWRCSLSMGLMFPVLAGAAGLLSPNGIMPDYVRYWHMLEIGWSNFVFGMIVGYVFWKGAEPEKLPEAGSVAA